MLLLPGTHKVLAGCRVSTPVALTGVAPGGRPAARVVGRPLHVAEGGCLVASGLTFDFLNYPLGTLGTYSRRSPPAPPRGQERAAYVECACAYRILNERSENYRRLLGDFLETSRRSSERLRYTVIEPPFVGTSLPDGWP